MITPIISPAWGKQIRGTPASAPTTEPMRREPATDFEKRSFIDYEGDIDPQFIDECRFPRAVESQDLNVIIILTRGHVDTIRDPHDVSNSAQSSP
jgi:hypothetical protein